VHGLDHELVVVADEEHAAGQGRGRAGKPKARGGGGG
jgi:hypothetical protein